MRVKLLKKNFSLRNSTFEVGKNKYKLITETIIPKGGWISIDKTIFQSKENEPTLINERFIWEITNSSIQYDLPPKVFS